MNYFILCYSKDNFDVAMKEGLIGFPESDKKVATLIKKGDRVIFYVGKETVNSGPAPKDKIQKFLGSAEVVSENFYDNRLYFKPRGDEIFASRFKIKVFNKSLRVPIKDMLSKLKFITNTLYWALPLRNGWVQSSEKDWELIHNTKAN